MGLLYTGLLNRRASPVQQMNFIRMRNGASRPTGNMKGRPHRSSGNVLRDRSCPAAGAA